MSGALETRPRWSTSPPPGGCRFHLLQLEPFLCLTPILARATRGGATDSLGRAARGLGGAHPRRRSPLAASGTRPTRVAGRSFALPLEGGDGVGEKLQPRLQGPCSRLRPGVLADPHYHEPV